MSPDPILLRRVLRRLAREFPNLVEVSTLPEVDDPDGHRALFYLAEKGLVEPGFVSERSGRPREMLEARITARGLDWLQLESDGPPAQGATSLSFELEALRHFLKQSIEGSGAAPDTKRESVARLMAFSDAEMKALILRLLQTVSGRPEVIIELIAKTGK